MLEVMEQYRSYPLLSYCAELGGYAGVFLGLSMLQLSDFFLYIFSGTKKLSGNLKWFRKLSGKFLKRPHDVRT